MQQESLSYATPTSTARSSVLGVVTVSFALIAGIVYFISFQYKWNLGGLISFKLGFIALVISVIAVSWPGTRTITAWISFGLSIAFWISVVLTESHLGKL